MTVKELENYTLSQVITNCLGGLLLKDVFTDYNEISYGSWSNVSVDVECILQSGKKEIVELLLYRESLSKDGTVRTDDDPNLGLDYAGRYTLQAFFKDGDVFNLCLDCGLTLE